MVLRGGLMKRVFACADIHGHWYAWKLLLEKAGYNPRNDLLIVLGDLIDRGPDSYKTVQFARELEKEGAKILIGNHEVAAHAYSTGTLEETIYFKNYGGSSTVRSYVDQFGIDALNKLAEDCDWLLNMPLTFELEHYFFCHAGFDVSKPLNEQTEEFVWGTNNFLYKETGIPKLVIFGHNEAIHLRGDKQHRPWLFKGKMCINTGADIGGWLSLIELPKGIVYSTQCVNTPFPIPDPSKIYPGKVITYKLGR